MCLRGRLVTELALMRLYGRTKWIPRSTRRTEGGVWHIPEGIVADGMKPLYTSRDNHPCNHDYYARQSEGYRG